MRAAVIVEQGGRRQLSIQNVPVPEPGPGEIVVRVRASGLNRADLALNPNHRQTGPKQAHPVAGLEYAGEVAAVGSGVTAVKEGDKVMGSTSGAYAEYCRTDGRLTQPVPDGLSWEQAATLPVALQTMHDALVTNGRLMAGDSVLIQGAASGVGVVGLQIAKLKGASVVIGGSRSDEKLKELAAFGMDVGINTSAEGWADKVKDATGGRGVDLNVDMVSGVLANGNMQAAAILGRIVNVGRLGGMKGEFDFDLHALKRIDYIGVTFRTRTPEEVQAIIRRMIDDLWPDVTAGRIRLPIDRRFSLEQAGEAQAYMKSNAHLGKIVLVM
jgi:NADPH2:quinone reductase